MIQEKLYTQEQLDIALLKNNNEGIIISLNRLDNSINKLETKIDSNLHWTIGLMFGLYAMVVTGLLGALGHSYGWF